MMTTSWERDNVFDSETNRAHIFCKGKRKNWENVKTWNALETLKSVKAFLNLIFSNDHVLARHSFLKLKLLIFYLIYNTMNFIGDGTFYVFYYLNIFSYLSFVLLFIQPNFNWYFKQIQRIRKKIFSTDVIWVYKTIMQKLKGWKNALSYF